MGRPLVIDISDLMDTIDVMKRALSPSAANEMMRRTFNDAGRKVKTIIRKEVPKEYAVTASWAGSAVGWPKAMGGMGVGVTIPIKGKRGSIGGTFKALSFRRGKKTRGRVRAKIVKGQTSTLPNAMAHQGGQPPFMARGVAFTRKYAHSAKPIVHVVGLGVPQMPLNRSEDDVRREIRNVLEKRLVHHFGQLFGK